MPTRFQRFLPELDKKETFATARMWEALRTAPSILGRAGLLDGYACTLHWRSHPPLRSLSRSALARSIYIIDRTRFTRQVYLRL